MYIFSGYIDLSKRRVSPEEIIKCEEKFARAKCVRKYFYINYNRIVCNKSTNVKIFSPI